MGRTFIVMDEGYYSKAFSVDVVADTDVMAVNVQYGKGAVVIECMFGWNGDNTLGFVKENFADDCPIGDFYAAIAEAPESAYRLVSVGSDGTCAEYGTLEIPGLIPYTETQICWR